MNQDKINFEAEVIVIQNTLNRILRHQEDLKNDFKAVQNNMAIIIDSIHQEKTDRMKEMTQIKDELHNRINTILFSILGGAFMFISGIILWVIERKA